MDQGFRFLCPREARKLILVVGITAALLLVFQYCEFPSSTILVSVFAAVNNSSLLFGQSPVLVNDLNSSNASSSRETDVVISEVSNDSGRFVGGSESKGKEGSHGGLSNISSVSAINGSSNLVLPLPPSASPPQTAPSNKTVLVDTKVGSPVDFVDLNTSPVRKDGAKSGEISGLQLSNSSVSERGSSITKRPALKRLPFKRAPSKVIPLSQMKVLLQQSHASSSSVKPRWPSDVDQELLFAKAQIQNAPDALDDTRIYAPIYRNISMFKRSYELMESMLKVYVYQDGEKPIFHQPILDGIYSSEGWFMKHMEASKKFVTKDPKKAHLFYFPFSSRLLEETLYVRHSHSRNNLIEYMKNYVNMMAAKYPFWNRTDGTDHFLAACHDWAPAETRGRILKSIRALCNADIDAGFSIGKDVSLPETYVHSAQNPTKYLGGNPPSQRPVLAFFAGNLHGYVRPLLLEYWENKDPDMKIYGPMPNAKGKPNYFELMKSSKFCICPKGHEVNSPRIVEAIFYDCVPVIISDNYVPPFFEVLNWESFAVIVPEKDIPNLKNILLSISGEKYVEMHKRVKKVQEHFLWHTKPVKYDLFHMILHSVWYNRIFQMKPA
ncbi:hypothetical protein Tsubulata_938939 [Turnera subulata]|uniref:Exostosin GT47 domain-containing protein n=1 Tax=Turnera subulata TaxID=218843 RepID=A0A9Q0GHV8_9ROSI|nr:hypothetical protein Tsubulata_938939 [Turnera subulata]